MINMIKNLNINYIPTLLKLNYNLKELYKTKI